MDMAHVLAIESNFNGWDTLADGVPIWADIRGRVYKLIAMRDRSYQTGVKLTTRGKLLQPGLLGLHLRTLKNIYLNKRPYSTFIYQNPITRTIDPRTSEPVDRIYGAYYDLLPNGVILETQSESNQYSLNKLPVISFSTLKLWLMPQIRLRRISPVAEKTIDDFVNDVCHLFDIPVAKPQLAERARYFVRLFHVQSDFLRRWIIPRLQSKVAFVHLGAYLGGRSILNSVLHEAGISVVEQQHGVLGFPYQYPVDWQVDGHLSHTYMPDTLLTFGTYWHQFVQAPFDTTSIGYPFLEEQVNHNQQVNDNNTTSILIISQPTIRDQLVSITKILAQKFTDYDIVFKPHPQELMAGLSFAELVNLSNVHIMYDGSVYSAIAQCGIIVGYNSLVLFEVAAYDNKRLFSLRNNFIPDGLGSQFDDVEELLAWIPDESQGQIANASQFWQPNSRENLAGFLARYGL
jgi:hypothetical protein